VEEVVVYHQVNGEEAKRHRTESLAALAGAVDGVAEPETTGAIEAEAGEDGSRTCA
jgi:hypothetical protein